MEKKEYDFNELLEMLKKEGIEMVEETAKKSIGVFADWLEKSAKESENKYDDLGLVVLPQLKELALGAADNINPEDNE